MTGHKQLSEVNLARNEKKNLIREDLQQYFEADLVEFLTSRLDAFAWQHHNITKISPDVITHKLNVDPNYIPIQRKRGNFRAERYQIIYEDVNRILKAGMIKEVHYLDWLANVVIVQK